MVERAIKVMNDSRSQGLGSMISNFTSPDDPNDYITIVGRQMQVIHQGLPSGDCRRCIGPDALGGLGQSLHCHVQVTGDDLTVINPKYTAKIKGKDSYHCLLLTVGNEMTTASFMIYAGPIMLSSSLL